MTLEWLGDVNLAWPWALLALFTPIIFRWFKPKENEQQTVQAPSIAVYNRARAKHAFSSLESVKKHKRKKVSLCLIWCLLVLALARPSYVGAPVELSLEGRDLMLAIDISPSMNEVDMPLNGQRAMRIDVVKKVAGDFMEQRNGDRIGLILFGSQPYVQAPLSFDTETVNTLLQEAFLGMAGQATAIGDAIALAVKRLRDRPEQSRVLVLLTDGANTAGEIPPEKAAQLAAGFNIKIYTIGIGADEMLRRSLFGTRRINPSADLDETMLRTIADTTGGQYFRARSTDELDAIYDEINRLEPIEIEARSFRPQKSLAHWFLLSALGLFLFYKLIVLAQTYKLRWEANRHHA